jgi:AraC family cel operon transcriptional repressor
MKTLKWKNLKWRTPLFKLYCHHLREGELIDFHQHDFYEIFWVLSGQLEHTVNGESSILHPGSLVWIRSLDVHCLMHSKQCKRVIFYNLAVPSFIISELLERYPELGRYLAPGEKQPIAMSLSSLQLEWLNSIAERMQQGGSRLELDRFLINLMAELQNYKSNPYRNCPRWLAEACAQLSKPENLTLGSKAIAIISKRSPEHVARELRKYAGMTPSMAVNAARVEYAAKLLASSHWSITDIAFMCGFGNVTCFFEKFRKAYHCSPLAFRKKYRLQ